MPDRPAQDGEIEITPEMIEAGIDAFSDYDLDLGELGAALRAAFGAMIRAGLAVGACNTPQERIASISGL